MQKTLNLGVIGGGLNSAVGRSHAIASQMDGIFKIVAGCFSRDSKTNHMTASSLNISASRCYDRWQDLLKGEVNQLDAILILTPTPQHAEIITEAIKAGFPVVSEKALCVDLEEASRIRRELSQRQGFLAVTYNYTGYPMIRELRELVLTGRLGRLVNCVLEMPQEGFMRLDGTSGQPVIPQVWRRTDGYIPTLSLDLGVHVHHMIHFLTGLSPLRVCAVEATEGNVAGVVDNIFCIAQYQSRFQAQIWYGKISLGQQNGLRVRIFGTKGSAEWRQTEPEALFLSDEFGGVRILNRASRDVTIANQNRYSRFKPGHPAGFVEAFSNYYSDIATALLQFNENREFTIPYVAGMEEAESGLRFLHAIATSAKTHAWAEVAQGNV